VTSTPTVRYDEALESLVDASHRCRTVVTAVQEESSSTGALWTPIYADLLNELMREVTAAGEQYAQAADGPGSTNPNVSIGGGSLRRRISLTDGGRELEVPEHAATQKGCVAGQA